MNEFEEVFSESLGGMKQAFDQADRDLHEVISGASRGLQKFTDGKHKLSLNVQREAPDGRSYLLGVGDERGVATAGYYRIPQSGYAIEFGHPVRDTFAVENYLSDRAEVAEHLKAMIRNPDSALMTRLAFLVRDAAG